MAQPYTTPQDVSTSLSPNKPSPNRIKCEFPGCGKLFTRKEHLTRHLKSHDPELQHECPVCGRRYARSDVLKRHLDHHSQSSGTKRTLVACTSCHERKLKCDEISPCRSCVRSSIRCSRTAANWAGRTSRSANVAVVSGATNANRTITASESADNINASASPDLQYPWFQMGESISPIGEYPDIDMSMLYSTDLATNVFPLWGGSPFGRGANADLSTAIVTDDTSFLLHTIDPTIKQWMSEPRLEIERIEPSMSTFASDSPESRSSGSFEQDHVVDLRRYLSQNSAHVENLLRLYFTDLHPYWPILHAPTFDPRSASPVLVGSMVLLASWLKGDPDHVKLASLVFDGIASARPEFHLSFDQEITTSSLHTLQALLLCVVYALYFLLTQELTTKGMAARAVHFNSILISTCRHSGIFNGQNRYYELGDCPFDLWLVQEQLHRLAFSALRVDAYLSVLMDYPPSVRYQEISIPLPKSMELWMAATEKDRRSLQWNEPAGREKALFCFLVRDILDTGDERQVSSYLTHADYHLALCSLQVGTWETAREAFCCCDSDELITDAKIRDPVQIFRTQLRSWRKGMEKDCQINHVNPSSTRESGHIFPQLNLLLFHISSLTINAPLKLLQRQGCCFKCRPSTGTGLPTHKTRARLNEWMSSPHPRTALWHAAQICQSVGSNASIFSAQPTLNPLSIPGLLKSAIAVCSYSHHNRACSDCTGAPRGEVVNLFAVPDDSEALKAWKEHGVGSASWGTDGIPICQSIGDVV
ncbi:Transcription factor protein [Rutstroemia sp. NJR-2017a BBW]|nr:Transcription factor protein [Rutstroemia sp. NJR-2017a BBW]